MKFSQVFVILTVLFAISFAVPANWKADEDLMTSNDYEEKRFATWAARRALGWAIKAACRSRRLSGRAKGVCSCIGMVFGRDEEFDTEKRWFSNAVGKLRGTVNKYCRSWMGRFLRGPCGCVTRFI